VRPARYNVPVAGRWPKRVLTLLMAPLAACSLLVDRDVGVRDGDESDGGVPSDGGPDGGGGPGPCGSIGRLQDEFSGSELSWHWVPRTQGAAANQPVTDGVLRLRFDPVPGADEFTEVESRFAYDLRDHDVTVRALDQGAAGWTTLEVRAAGAFDRPRRIIGLGRLGDDLVAFVAGDPIDTIRSVPFNGGDHRYWRIRESGGVLEFEVAGDSRVFSPFTSLTDPGLDLGAVTVGLQLFSGDPPNAAIGSSVFDDFNAGADADPACSIDTLHDDFSAADLGPLWIDNGDQGLCDLSTGDGLSLAVDSGAACYVDSARAYSFAGGGVLVAELTEMPDPADARTALRLAHDPENFAELVQQDGELTISLTERGAESSSLTLPNAVNAQVWRVTERDGDLVVETSTDGDAFSLRHTLSPVALDLAELRVSFSLRSSPLAGATLAGINVK